MDHHLRQIGTVVLSGKWRELSDKSRPLFNSNYVTSWQLVSSRCNLQAVTWMPLSVAFSAWIQIVNMSRVISTEFSPFVRLNIYSNYINHWTKTWGSRVQIVEDMRYMTIKQRYKRIIKYYNLNYIIVDCRHKWTQCLLRMNDKCIAMLVYEYIPIGRRNFDQPRKRRRDKDPWRWNKPEKAYTLVLLMMSASSLGLRISISNWPRSVQWHHSEQIHSHILV